MYYNCKCLNNICLNEFNVKTNSVSKKTFCILRIEIIGIIKILAKKNKTFSVFFEAFTHKLIRCKKIYNVWNNMHLATMPSAPFSNKTSVLLYI